MLIYVFVGICILSLCFKTKLERNEQGDSQGITVIDSFLLEDEFYQGWIKGVSF